MLWSGSFPIPPLSLPPLPPSPPPSPPSHLFLFAQGLVSTGYITSTLTYSVGDVSNGVQDLLICIEMFLASVAHYFFFSYADMTQPRMLPAIRRISGRGEDEELKAHSCFKGILDLFPLDLAKETSRNVRGIIRGSSTAFKVPQVGEWAGVGAGASPSPGYGSAQVTADEPAGASKDSQDAPGGNVIDDSILLPPVSTSQVAGPISKASVAPGAVTPAP